MARAPAERGVGALEEGHHLVAVRVQHLAAVRLDDALDEGAEALEGDHHPLGALLGRLQLVGVHDVDVEEAPVAHELERDAVLEGDARLHGLAQPAGREGAVAAQRRRLEAQHHAVGELDLVAVAERSALGDGRAVHEALVGAAAVDEEQALALAHDLGVEARDALVRDRHVAALGAADRDLAVAEREAPREQPRRAVDHRQVAEGGPHEARAAPDAPDGDGLGDGRADRVAAQRLGLASARQAAQAPEPAHGGSSSSMEAELTGAPRSCRSETARVHGRPKGRRLRSGSRRMSSFPPLVPSPSG